MASILRGLTMLGAVTLAVAPPLEAQHGSARIQEDEGATFMSTLAHSIASCDGDWVAAQFLPYANIQIAHADGTREVFDPPEYSRHLRRYCAAYRRFKPDGRSFQVSSSGSTTTLRWRSAWGGNELGQPGASKVIFDDWTTLVKEGQRIRISGAGEQIYDVEPGAEAKYFPWRRTDLFGPMKRWVAALKSRLTQKKQRDAQR